MFLCSTTPSANEERGDKVSGPLMEFYAQVDRSKIYIFMENIPAPLSRVPEAIRTRSNPMELSRWVKGEDSGCL